MADEYENIEENEEDIPFQKAENNTKELMAGAMVLVMFMATNQLFQQLPIPSLARVATTQRSRYQIHGMMENKEGPWNFSPTGYMESQLVNAIMDTMKEQGITINDIDRYTRNFTRDETNLFRGSQNTSESVGYFGSHESRMQGELGVYMPYEVMIPWTTCEDNGNCSSDAPVCDYCEELSGELFLPDDVPDTHDWCRCNEPMADPVRVPV